MSDTENGPRGIATWVFTRGGRPYCTRPWNQIAVLSDGTAVCACIDAEKTNPLGSFKTQSFDEIWNGPRYAGLRKAITNGAIDAVPICRNCPNRVDGPPPPAGLSVGVPKPKALFLESHIGCNLACPGCNRDGMMSSRDQQILDVATFRKVIDSLSPGLRYMEFHVGGENYMHREASAMVRYCKEKNDDCFVLSSTNGHFFHTEKLRQDVLDSGIDCIVFSVDGARQESYEKYRVKGDLKRVLDGMRGLAEMKREQGRDKPLLIWRYLLFEWNDSPEEMDEARALAREIGVDHFAWHLNAVSTQKQSPRYYVGSPHLHEIEHELWDTLPLRTTMAIDVDFGAYVA